MALHNIRKDHGYGEQKIARIAEDLPFNVDLLEKILEQEHYVRDFTPRQLIPEFPSQARVAATGSTTINSTTPTLITGATVTFTPAVECYIQPWMVFDAESSSTSIFIGQVFVDGVGIVASANMAAASGTRLTISQVAGHQLLTAASHTVELRGSLSAAVGSYNVRLTHTGFVYRLKPVAHVVELAQRQQVVILPDAVNGEVAVTFPRPSWWLQGRMEVSVKYGGSVSSANAWRADLLANALADTDIETTLADVNASADIPGIGTTGRRKWYPFTTTLLVDRSHDMISVRLRRAGGHANDTYAGDVYLHQLRCRYVPSRHEV